MGDLPVVTLYGKADCHLCDEAEAMLVRATSGLAVSYQKVDIHSSPELFELLRYRIPVVEVKGGPSLDWPTTSERIRRAILAGLTPR